MLTIRRGSYRSSRRSWRIVSKVFNTEAAEGAQRAQARQGNRVPAFPAPSACGRLGSNRFSRRKQTGITKPTKQRLMRFARSDDIVNSATFVILACCLREKFYRSRGKHGPRDE